MLGIVFLPSAVAAAGTLLGISLFDGLLFYCILPRKYQIYADRLVILMGAPFSKTIRLADIKSARRVAGSYAFGYNGLRFTTSSDYVVEILRQRGMGIVISPAGREYFVDQLKRALQRLATSPDALKTPGNFRG